jgi:uncharacterized protein DUF4169
MGDVVNLRQARKQKARAEKERRAEQNRVRWPATNFSALSAVNRSRSRSALERPCRRELPGDPDA